MSASPELKAAKQQVLQVFMGQFVALHPYDQQELLDSIWGDLSDMQHMDSPADMANHAKEWLERNQKIR
jgi:hypothetical protein